MVSAQLIALPSGRFSNETEYIGAGASLNAEFPASGENVPALDAWGLSHLDFEVDKFVGGQEDLPVFGLEMFDQHISSTTPPLVNTPPLEDYDPSSDQFLATGGASTRTPEMDVVVNPYLSNDETEESMPVPSSLHSHLTYPHMMTEGPFSLVPLPLPAASGYAPEEDAWGPFHPTFSEEDEEEEGTELELEIDDEPCADSLHPSESRPIPCKAPKKAYGGLDKKKRRAAKPSARPSAGEGAPSALEGRPTRPSARKSALNAADRERERLSLAGSPGPVVSIRKKEGKQISVQLQPGMELLDMEHLRQCQYCGSIATPQWRSGPNGKKSLCNRCGVRYRAGRLPFEAKHPGKVLLSEVLG